MELNYQIALTSVPFDNSYKNVLRFDTRSEQEAYFKTNTLFSNSPQVNFNVGSLYATNVIYDGNENENIGELLNKNYCIVKDNRQDAQIKYYYYYVTNAIQDCDNRIKLALELDIFQTYYIDLRFGDGIVYKSHLNRFVDNGDGTVSFDGSPTSKLFEREDITNVAKRLTSRQKLNLYQFEDETLNNWFNENVVGWVYLFVDGSHKFKLGNPKTSEYQEKEYSIPNCTYLQYGFEEIEQATPREGVPNNLSIICAPIYNNSTKHLYIKLPYQNAEGYESSFDGTEISTLDIDAFMKSNGGANYVYSYKFSIIPPFYFGYTPTYRIGEFGLTIDYTRVYEDTTTTAGNCGRELYGTLAYKTLEGGVVLNLNRQDYQIQIDNILEFDIKFNKQEIINSNKNYKFNPKLNSSDYKDLRLTNNIGDYFNYDLQKLNTSDFKILISETITPDISKQYTRILPPENNVYNKQTAQNLLGLISQNDNSLTLISTAYQTMLANNKNYFLQNAINRELDRIQGTAKAVTNASMGNIFGGIGKAIETGVDYAKSKINEQLTVDNLQNAPSTIQGAKGNAIFSVMYTEPGIYIEQHEILDNEKEMINDYMCLYGFTYNRVDNVKNVDNIRKIYNYVRADIETINGANISETVHQKFRQCFANGVRFWNTDTFSYEKENYERWLENE